MSDSRQGSAAPSSSNSVDGDPRDYSVSQFLEPFRRCYSMPPAGSGPVPDAEETDFPAAGGAQGTHDLNNFPNSSHTQCNQQQTQPELQSKPANDKPIPAKLTIATSKASYANTVANGRTDSPPTRGQDISTDWASSLSTTFRFEPQFDEPRNRYLPTPMDIPSAPLPAMPGRALRFHPQPCQHPIVPQPPPVHHMQYPATPYQLDCCPCACSAVYGPCHHDAKGIHTHHHHHHQPASPPALPYTFDFGTANPYMSPLSPPMFSQPQVPLSYGGGMNGAATTNTTNGAHNCGQTPPDAYRVQPAMTHHSHRYDRDVRLGAKSYASAVSNTTNADRDTRHAPAPPTFIQSSPPSGSALNGRHGRHNEKDRGRWMEDTIKMDWQQHRHAKNNNNHNNHAVLHDDSKAMWVGNLPTGITESDIRDFFDHRHNVTSVAYISKTRCAFVNFESTHDVEEAIHCYNHSFFKGCLVACKSRKDYRPRKGSASSSGSSGDTRAMTAAALIPSRNTNTNNNNNNNKSTSPSSTSTRRAGSHNSTVSSSSGAYSAANSSKKGSPMSSGSSSSSQPPFENKYFILKSLTKDDLDIAREKGLWATQPKNEPILNKAFAKSRNVYLIFSANKSGEFYGYARMESPIDASTADHIDWVPVTINNAGNSVTSAASATDAAAATPPATSDAVDRVPPKWGTPFRIAWHTTHPLPFPAVNHIYNAWNGNKPVKISRDGIELDTLAGGTLLDHFATNNNEDDKEGDTCGHAKGPHDEREKEQWQVLPRIDTER
ncbi:YT521-B-like domain-containing protein [Powellomyces hirtus]|nr:YT521-B-like domain-containing protein [Powellomyces hirtus]